MLVCLVLAIAASARADRAAFERDFQTITSFGSRFVGSPGYQQSLEYVRQQLAAIPGVEVREHTYDVLVPRTHHATLTLADGRSATVAPLWPAYTRLSATPIGGVRGKLVYAGDCEYAGLKPSALRGGIAVIEPSAGTRWQRPFYFGARAVIVLSDKDATNAEYQDFGDIKPPANLPRFYLADESFAAALRTAAELGDATLDVSADWTRVRATNLYALFMPPGGTTPVRGKPPAALTVAVPIDGASLVYDAAPAASQAVNVAATLELARSLSSQLQHPDAGVAAIGRPILFAFTGADAMAQLGVRNMLLALAETPITAEREIGELDPQLATLRVQRERLTEIGDEPWRLDPLADRDLVQRLITLVETDLSIQQDKLFRIRVMPEDRLTPEMRKQADYYSANQIRLAGVRSSLQTDPRTLVDPSRRELAGYYARLALTRIAGGDGLPGLESQLLARRTELTDRSDLYTWLANRIGRPTRPEERDTTTRLLDVMIGLDLADGGTRVGPMFQGSFLRLSAKGQIQNYSDWMLRTRDDAAKGVAGATWWNAISGNVDLEPLSSSRTPGTFLGGVPLTTELATSWGVPGFTFATLDDFRLRRDTPNDTADRIDLGRVWPQLEAISTLMSHAAAEPSFANDAEVRRSRNGFVGQVVGSAPGKPVPNLPMTGYVVGYQFTTNILKIPTLQGAANYAIGIRRTEVRDTDVEGHYRFEGISKYPTNLLKAFVQAFYLEPGSGAVRAISDLGRASTDLSPFADLTTTINPIRSLPFECDELTLVGLYDPRFLQSLGEVQIIDARRNSDAARFSATLYDRVLAAFVEPDSKNYFLFRYGQIGNRIVLLNMPEDVRTADRRAATLGRGLTVEQVNALGPLSVETARDFHQLDERRRLDYREAGVSSALIDAMHADAGAQLDAARSALTTDDAVAAVRNANGAWASEALVYAALKATSSDVIRAAIFLLLLAVPFSVCMERLLISSPNVYKQIAGIGAIFLLMTGALWTFHPAFKISTSPLIIILSFAIIFMSLIVIGVVYQKFDTELKKIRSGRGPGGEANFLRASVLTNAVMLGIANMRKRKIRTTLTATTIVLITFAVLVFASAASYRSTKSLPVGIAASHPGLMLRQRGWRPMPIDIVSELKVVFPAQQIVERWWTVHAGDPNEVNLLVAGGESGSPRRVAAIPALLGLSPGESKLSKIASVLGVEKFDRLERGESNVIYLPRDVASQLAVSEGETIRSGGIPLTVAGIFDPTAFDRDVMTLAGEPLTPLKYESNALDVGGRKLSDNAAESITIDANGGESEMSAVYQHLPAAQIAIIPASVAQRLNNARLASVALTLPDAKQAQAAADEIAKRFTIVTYAGLDDGVQLISASTPTKVTGSQVAIPLVLGGLIIFNTMMGSIAERKREIHIYTSLGLAPLHVGALFLAEALTYGVIGTVFGYIIGQGVGTAMLKLGWLGNVTLDYSGTSALLTIGLILMVVLLSALVPARLASKIAAPSIERTWRVPLPKDGQIIATLPFTINKKAAEGVTAYLAEFFEQHKEGSIGKFAADDVKTFAWDGHEPSSHGKPSRGVQTTIWLTPFDLGVKQHLMLLIHPGKFPEIYEVQVLLSRLSGDDSSWYRMNRSFLTELRKQFLQWRSLSPARMREYIDQSRRLLGKA